jgi:hypothetical protein
LLRASANGGDAMAVLRWAIEGIGRRTGAVAGEQRAQLLTVQQVALGWAGELGGALWRLLFSEDYAPGHQIVRRRASQRVDPPSKVFESEMRGVPEQAFAFIKEALAADPESRGILGQHGRRDGREDAHGKGAARPISTGVKNPSQRSASLGEQKPHTRITEAQPTLRQLCQAVLQPGIERECRRIIVMDAYEVALQGQLPEERWPARQGFPIGGFTHRYNCWCCGW